MRQKNQLELNLGTGATGEARSAAAQETEARAARTEVESRAAVGPSMEVIVERNNLKKALLQVQANKGAAGVDGMSVEDLAPYRKNTGPRSGLSCSTAPTNRSRCGASTYRRHRAARARSASRRCSTASSSRR